MADLTSSSVSTTHYQEVGFRKLVFEGRTNKIYMGLWVMVTFLSWLIFKSFYPNPNIIFDSYYYIYAALVNDNISVWPIGYSRFLQFFGLFTHSVNALVIVQYVFLQFCFYLFFVSIRCLLKLRKLPAMALAAFFLLNPIYVFTCNLVMSDAMFLSLSTLWLTNLLWLVLRPKGWMIITQALLLLFTFTIRPSALIYPFIAGFAFLLSRLPTWLKIAGILSSFLMVGGFMAYTTQAYSSQYGVKQYSAFQGWKKASNALYAYEHVPRKEIKPVPPRFQKLDSLVHQYFNSRHILVNILNPDPSWGTYYVFMYPSPLLLYKDRQYGQDFHFLINVRTFAEMGPLYDEYGSYIIKKYPFTYIRYFVLPNIWLYMMPYPEVYYDPHNPFNLQRDTLGVMAKKWFGNISLAAPPASINFRAALFTKYPLLDMAVHLFFIITFLGFFVLKGYRKINRLYAKVIYLVTLLWLANFVFFIAASASLLRYELFIIVVEFTFAVYVIDLMNVMESNRLGLPSSRT